MRILYVEDNPTNLLLVRRVARQHDLISYIDGEEALSKFDQDNPDLVLMDLQLAGKLNGLEVVGELRQRGYSGPIIAVTAYAMMGDRERCLEAGCDDYIAKPLPIPRLVSLFEHYQQALTDPQAEIETVEAEPVNAAGAASSDAVVKAEAEANADADAVGNVATDDPAANETETVEAEAVTSPPTETEPPAAEPVAEAQPVAEAEPATETKPATDQQPAEAVILPEPSFVSTSDQDNKKPDSVQPPGPDDDRKPADD